MARFNTALTSSSISGTATISTPYSGAFTEFTGTAPYTVTLPSPTLFPGINQTFYNATSGQVTLSVSGATFSGTGGTGSATFVLNAGNVVSIFSDGTNYIVISEDGSPLVATTGSFSGNVTINGGSATLSATPQTITLNPTGTSTIDNINIGSNTRASGAFTTLAANQAVTFSANTSSSSSTTGTLVVTGGMGVSGNINSGATVTGVNLAGTISTAAQTNITSVGALTSLTVNGTTLLTGAFTATGLVMLGANQSNGGRVNITDGVAKTSAQSGILIFGTTTAGANDYQLLISRSAAGTGAYHSLQSVEQGIAYRDIALQPNGGNVGIGTTAPGATVEIYKSLASTTTAQQMLIINTDYASGIGTGFGGAIVFRGRTAGNVLQDNAQILGYNEDTNDNGYALGFFTRPTVAAGLQQRMTILRYGNVGIGTSAPSYKLHVNGNTFATGITISTGGGTNVANTVNIDTNGGGAARYYSHGGDAATKGSHEWHLSSSNGSLDVIGMTLANTGNLTISGTLTESSSITLKENVDPIYGALASVLQLSGKIYDRIDNKEKREAGLIAEEVYKVLPNLVHLDEDGKPAGVKYTKTVAYLVESIKELYEEIRKLKGQ